MADIGRASVPSQNLSIANEKNYVLQGRKQEFSNLSRKTLVKHKSQIINITGEMIADLCRDGVVTIGETKLGIRRSEIGTRSIRSGAAMAICTLPEYQFSRSC